MMTEGRPYQLVIFGATGFTGQFVVEEVARVADGADFQSQELRWAVAGRNREKLQGVLNKAAQKLAKPQLKSIDILICDVSDEAALAEMAKKATVILDCVGPYRLYGEVVVKACVENGAHFVDISGETQYLEAMYLKYNSQAAQNGVYVIGSSGFDSIPADIGVLFTRKSLQGTLTAVESFVSFKFGPQGGGLHEGTWESAIHFIGDQDNLKNLRRQLAFKPLPVVGQKIKKRGAIFYSDEVQKYAVPFVGSDAPVVERTQRYLYEKLQETPVQYNAYLAVGGLGSVMKLTSAGMRSFPFALSKCGRNQLIKHPKYFSLGFFSKEGPTPQQMEETSFTMTLFGEGYSHDQDPQKGRPNLRICTQVSGPEPGYHTTPIAMVQVALTLLKEPECLPSSGGVYTPGAACFKTKLIERLEKGGIHFTVISRTEV